MWRSGQLGNQSALALLNVNLLNLVKRMGIKGRKDLYMLRVEDFEVSVLCQCGAVGRWGSGAVGQWGSGAAGCSIDEGQY